MVVVIVIGCIHLPYWLILSLACVEKDKESLFTAVNSIILPAFQYVASIGLNGSFLNLLWITTLSDDLGSIEALYAKWQTSFYACQVLAFSRSYYLEFHYFLLLGRNANSMNNVWRHVSSEYHNSS